MLRYSKYFQIVLCRRRYLVECLKLFRDVASSQIHFYFHYIPAIFREDPFGLDSLLILPFLSQYLNRI